MFVIVCKGNYADGTKNLEQLLRLPTTLDFNIRENLAHLEVTNRPANCSEHCRTFDELAWLDKVVRLVNLEDSSDHLLRDLSENHSFWLQLVADTTDALVIVILAIPLSLSLLFSFHFTLWLLSKITSSSFKLTIVLCPDMFVAIAAPLILFTAFMLVGALIGISLVGGFVDFTYFDEASVTTLIVGESSMLVTLALHGLLVIVLDAWRSWQGLLLLLQLPILNVIIYTTAVQFIFDTWKVAHLDFSPGFTEGAVNFAIDTDILYSLVFVAPGLGIVFIQRWPFGQRTFLNFIEWIADHPQSPIYAFGTILLWPRAIWKAVRGEKD
jgi:hypothetical protein